MASNRNRTEGHRYEIEEARLLRESGLFPHVVTTRSENRTRDGQKVDLINKDEITTGRIEYNFQCKSSAQLIPYPQLLSEMPQVDGIMNVVLNKQTKRAGTRFRERGRYVIINRDDFQSMMKYRRGFEILSSTVRSGASLRDAVEALTAIGLTPF